MPQPVEVDRLAEQLIVLFRQAQASIDVEVAGIVVNPPSGGRRLRRLGELKRTVDAHLTALEESTTQWLQGQFPRVYELGGLAGAASTADAFGWTLVHTSAVQELAGDTFADVLEATTHVRGDVKTWIREQGRRQTGLSLLEGRTAQQAARELTRAAAGEAVDALGGPVGVIRYADGSYRRMADYADMLLRTKTAQAYNAGTLNQLGEFGVEWVEVFDGSACGWTSHDDPNKANGKIVAAKEARLHSLAHPRCRRSFGGRPDIGDAEEAAGAKPSTTEAQRADQHAAEQRQEAAVGRRAAARAATKPAAARPSRAGRTGRARPSRPARAARSPRTPSVASTVPEGPTGIPVSKSADIRTSVARVRRATTHALEQIDGVHSDGQLPKIAVTGRPMRGARGHFDRAAMEIAVKGGGDWPELTATHEFGHFLDFAGIGQPGAMSSLSARTAPDVAELADWVAATDASDAIQSLKVMAPNARGRELRHVRYLLSDHERWARSYAQYIATRSQDPVLLEQLARAQQGRFPAQWADEDFVPIGEAMDRLFVALGWI